jgi:ParB/RepB/Spo0J family partition protein
MLNQKYPKEHQIVNRKLSDLKDTGTRKVSESEMRRMLESYRKYGIMHPAIIRKRKDSEKPELVSGHLRGMIVKRAGEDELPCIEVEMDDLDAACWSISENIDRIQRNLMDEAEDYEKLKINFKLSQQDTIDKLHLDKNQSYISETLSLNDHPESIKELIRNDRLKRSIAVELTKIKDIDLRIKLANLAADKEWTVKTFRKHAKTPQALNNDTVKQQSANLTSSKCSVPQLWSELIKEFKSKQETHECDKCINKKPCERIAIFEISPNDAKTEPANSSQMVPFTPEPDSPFVLRVREKLRKIELEQSSETDSPSKKDEPDNNLGSSKLQSENAKVAPYKIQKIVKTMFDSMGMSNYIAVPEKEDVNSNATKSKPKEANETEPQSVQESAKKKNTEEINRQRGTKLANMLNFALSDLFSSQDPVKTIKSKESQPETNAESTPDSASTSSPPSTQSPEPTINQINVKKSDSSPEETLLNYPESLDELPLSLENCDALKSARKNGEKLLFTGESKSLMIYAGEWLRKVDYGNDWDRLGRTFTTDELNKNYKNGKTYTPRERLMAVLNKVRFIPNPLPFRTIIIEDADRLNESVLEMLVPNLHKLCRIIFIAPSFEKVDKRIKECTKRIHFAKLEKNQIFQTINMLAQKIGFKISDDDLNQIIEDSHGSLKDAIHNLRVSYMIAKQATEQSSEW